MKLIIDIPEYAFERIKEYYDALHEDSTVDAKVCYIVNGIPLEQIRAEIEQERDKVYQNRQGCDTYYADGLDTALDIIDKYKGDKNEI